MRRHRATSGGKGLSALANAALGFYAVWVAHLGRRYGILQALARRKAPASASTVARGCGLHGPAVRVWCEAAVSLGLIEKRGNGYRLPAEMRPLLTDTEDLRFLGGQFSYLALRSLDFEAFDPFFRKGAISSSVSRHLREASEEATRWDHLSFEKFLLPRVPGLRARLQDGAAAVDVGCGTGGWVLRMAGAFPRSSFTGVDPDRTAIRIARGRASKIGGSAHIRFLEAKGGEPMREPDSFDLAYLGEMLYGVDDKLRVLRNCRRTLVAGGYIVIAEGLTDPVRGSGGRADRLVRAMDMDFAIQGARFFTRSELGALLRRAGFSNVRFHHAGGGLWFVVATPDSKRKRSERSGAARSPRGDR